MAHYLGGHEADQRGPSLFASRFAARGQRCDGGGCEREEEEKKGREGAADLVLGASGARPGKCRAEKGGRVERAAGCRVCLCCASGESGGEGDNEDEDDNEEGGDDAGQGKEKEEKGGQGQGGYEGDSEDAEGEERVVTPSEKSPSAKVKAIADCRLPLCFLCCVLDVDVARFAWR